jgi:hypothetical protein
MEVISDFEDLLVLLGRYKVRYPIVGGFAFVHHAVPRFTKDLDLWVDALPGNVRRTNLALAEFGSPLLLDSDNPDEILQIGLPPDRVDVLRAIPGLCFATAWAKRRQARYGRAPANWVDLDTLIRMKRAVGLPKHDADVQVLMQVRRRRKGR